MTVFPAGTIQVFQEKMIKTACFSLILCFSIFLAFLHFSFMNTSILITMLIASVFSVELFDFTPLWAAPCKIGVSISILQSQNSCMVSPCVNWLSPNPQVQTAPPLIMVPNGVCSDLLNHSAVNVS